MPAGKLIADVKASSKICKIVLSVSPLSEMVRVGSGEDVRIARVELFEELRRWEILETESDFIGQSLDPADNGIVEKCESSGVG